MTDIIQKDKCTGCCACFNVCPQKAITMTNDNEGFLYPEINGRLCNECGLCKKICPIDAKRRKYGEGTAYLCINKNEETRKISSSGGVFSLLAEYVVKNGGLCSERRITVNLKRNTLK